MKMGMTSTLASERTPAPSGPNSLATSLVTSISSVLAGRHEQIEIATACVLAGGHLLAEDIPGVGKTLLAQTAAASLGGTFARVQGTADLLPGHVTVDGTTHPVPLPFVVIATQNPVEMAGTYPLTEGVTDRFMAAISLGRATAEEEVEVLTGRRGRSRLSSVLRVATMDELATCRAQVQNVHLADAVASYAVGILHATRAHPSVRLGASTRGGVAMIALAKAFALMEGRDYVAPHDVGRAAQCALAHRLVLVGQDRSSAAQVVAECVAAVQAPRR